MRTKEKWDSIVAIVCFMLLAIALLIAHASPATGYELDIYNATPLSVWLCLSISFVGGIIILVHQIATKGYRDSRFWLIGLLVIILARITLLYLPFTRSYVTWGGDHISHIGYLKDIVLSGHFPSTNYYPVTHILLSQTVLVTGVSEITVANLSTAFLSIMFVLSTYLLATAVFPHRGQQLLATLLAGGVMLGGAGCNVFSNPNGWSILLFPLLFYCHFNRAVAPYRILLIILLVLYPFFHPLSALMVIVALIVIELSKPAFSFIARNRKTLGLIPISRFTLSVILLEAAILLPWVLTSPRFSYNLRLLLSQITTGKAPSVVGAMQATLGKIDMHGLDLVTLFFKLYGVTAILLILSVIGIYYLVRRIRAGDSGEKMPQLFALNAAFFSFGFLYFLYLLGAPGLQPIAGQRILSYAVILTPIPAVFALYGLSRGASLKYLASAGILCVVVLTSFLSIRGLYQSPYVIQPNAQVTRMEMTGMTWSLKEKDRTVNSVYIMSAPDRFADGILGTIEARKRVDTRYALPFSDHFAYAAHDSLGEQYIEDRYAAITEKDRIIYTTVWHEVGRFNDSDFMELEQDSTVDRLYSNYELDVYLIHGSAG
ncbi:MAG: hypothetical protein JW732_05710 [Dehalococcoidia bacterium]|nr:hypothetical protein [Dehalococcoidia bacterium]